DWCSRATSGRPPLHPPHTSLITRPQASYFDTEIPHRAPDRHPMPMNFPPIPPAQRGRGVTAVLGPTNTGKTHLAIERMLAHSSGVIGLPLRLLAREVYNKIVDRAGSESVALITGEEKIKPKNPRFWVSTVEAMPRDLDVSFLAVD